ncbi:MAG: hypothetical protein KGH63_03035, partial [Candidatus Micrarchaeota archaeon]|nr:hypothetical protein [Candidatus Micrarchaeota archaeon]
MPKIDLYAFGSQKVRQLKVQGASAKARVMPVAFANGLYVGPGLLVASLDPANRALENQVLGWGVPRPKVLAAWRAMKMLDQMAVIEDADLALCYYAATRASGQPAARANELDGRLDRVAREAIASSVPDEPDLLKMLQWFGQHRFRISVREVLQDVGDGLLPLTEPLRAQLGDWREAVRKEKEEELDGRTVGVLESLDQIRRMNHALA